MATMKVFGSLSLKFERPNLLGRQNSDDPWGQQSDTVHDDQYRGNDAYDETLGRQVIHFDFQGSHPITHVAHIGLEFAKKFFCVIPVNLNLGYFGVEDIQ